MRPVPPSDDKSYIDELKKSLYSRTAPDVRTKRKLRFADPTTEVKTDWEHPVDDEAASKPTELNQRYETHHMSIFTKVLIASALFCIAAVGIGAYLFFNGANLISADNIEIAINGPVSIAGGTPVSFDVTAINKNNVPLQTVDMSVDFPAGTTDPANPGRPLTTYQKLIGDMPTGGTAKQTVSAIIFGEENLQKEITVTLTYGIKGSSSVFTKTQTYDVLINSSPITVTASSFDQITSGQAFDMKVDLKSNSGQPLKNVVLAAQYPFGFSFGSASIAPSTGNSIWRVGDIPAGADRVITIHGTLTGEDTDLRAFHFTAGAASSANANAIGTEYTSVERDVTIQKPFISLGIAVNGDSSANDYVGQFGQSERVEIDWANNLPAAVSNMVITAKLSGTAYDKSSVQASNGVFDSVNDQIVWNQQTNPELTSVAAGANGKVSLTIAPKDSGSQGSPAVNPGITFNVSITGNRTQESNVSGSLASAAVRNIRVSSSVSLSGRAVRTIGPFTNTGPVPPVAEKATTYTIVWDVDNTSSAVTGARVTATLPAYVKWMNVVSPSTEDVAYDPNTGTVTWNVGAVNTYTYGSVKRRELSFQVSFTPSVTQVGQSPVLINQAMLSATDNFTQAVLTSKQDPLTTRDSTDPAYKESDETVVTK